MNRWRLLVNMTAVVSLLTAAGCGMHMLSTRAAASPVYRFNQKRAFSDLLAQCALGPRDPRLKAHALCESYIITQLKLACDEVTTQNFDYRDNARNVTLHLSNIFGVINPTGKPRIMISAHWDTRPTADNDFTLSNRDKPIMGADDGASGVAVLLEMARVLHQERPKCGIVLAFWDGEDWGPTESKMYLGSIYFANHPGPLRPDQSILLDMIGQKDLLIPKEAYSEANFPKLCDAVWDAAAQAGEGSVFQNMTGEEIYDDQIPLAKLNIPSIDIIDFNYTYWHTLQDTADKCSPNSLGAVGRTLEQYIRNTDAASAH